MLEILDRTKTVKAVYLTKTNTTLSNMLFSEKYFYLCHIPLSAESSDDVQVIKKCESNDEFSDLFTEYEKLRAHATNSDGLYSVIRADDVYVIIRTNNDKEAKLKAFEESRTNVITNLQHRVMQNKDQNAQMILKSVYQIETEIK